MEENIVLFLIEAISKIEKWFEVKDLQNRTTESEEPRPQVGILLSRLAERYFQPDGRAL